jgi:hypothetical protein
MIKHNLFIKSIMTLGFCSVFLYSIFAQDISRTVDNSRFVTQSIPDNMVTGMSYNSIVTFENTGTTTWSPDNYKLRITSGPNVGPMGTWGISDVNFSKFIEPGNTVSFELNLVAPSSEGTYLFQAQLMHNYNYFGETSKAVDVIVTTRTSSGEVFNSSAFVEQTVPTFMEMGRKYKVMVSMTNSGKTAWTPGKYRLVFLEPSGNVSTSALWGPTTVELNETIAPGSSKVFDFEVTPGMSGNQLFQWRMASSDGGLFGDATKSVLVDVRPPKIEKKNEGKRGKE